MSTTFCCRLGPETVPLTIGPSLGGLYHFFKLLINKKLTYFTNSLAVIFIHHHEKQADILYFQPWCFKHLFYWCAKTPSQEFLEQDEKEPVGSQPSDLEIKLSWTLQNAGISVERSSK